MGRFSCWSRKAQLDPADQPVPSRLVSAFRRQQSHSRPDLNIIVNSLPPLQLNAARFPPVQLPPIQALPLEQFPDPPHAMSHAARAGDGGRAQRARHVITISDSDDNDDDDVVVKAPPPRRRPQPAAARNGQLRPEPAAPPRADSEESLLNDGDNDDDDPFEDRELARILREDYGLGRGEQPAHRSPSNQPVNNSPPTLQETRIQCIDQVLAVFPGICRDYVSELYDTKAQSSDFLIGHIFEEKVEKGEPYPTAKDTQNSKKRKREVDVDEEAARKYGAADRVVAEGAGGLRPFIRVLLSKDFPETPLNFIDSALNKSGYRLFSTYLVLEEAHRTWNTRNPTYNKIGGQSKARRMDPDHIDLNLETTIQRMSATPVHAEDAEVLRELQAARRIRKKAEAKLLAEKLLEIEEEKNIQKAEADGTMAECGCCYGDFPLNRMVHCSSEDIHFFCRGCAKQNAETEIGNSKYILGCMSMDGCEGGFSLDQRKLFLDDKTTIALERNEQEANLRMCGIKNLASCPFCPFAAEYPPVEVNREFRCQNEECERVSCRLCNLDSHIPKTCAESAKENGLSIRRQVEEAMSAALIRTCNKCDTPFVKEEGCNKMTCTRNGCRNVQCYVCSKSCDYNHFDDTRRGGKSGNCPLFESVENRHETEVKEAEQEALNKVRAEHPEYSEDDLRVKMSENVLKDDQRRKANDPRMPPMRVRAAGLPGGHGAMRMHFMPARAAPGLGAMGQAGNLQHPALDFFEDWPRELVDGPPPPLPPDYQLRPRHAAPPGAPYPVGQAAAAGFPFFEEWNDFAEAPPLPFAPVIHPVAPVNGQRVNVYAQPPVQPAPAKPPYFQGQFAMANLDWGLPLGVQGNFDLFLDMERNAQIAVDRNLQAAHQQGLAAQGGVQFDVQRAQNMRLAARQRQLADMRIAQMQAQNAMGGGAHRPYGPNEQA